MALISPNNMTSDTAPSPYVVTHNSADRGVFLAWKCFDNDGTGNSYWQQPYPAQADVWPTWIKIDFGSSIGIPTSFKIKQYGSNYSFNACKFQGSNNNTDWTDLTTVNLANNSTLNEHSFSNTTAYRYFRWYFTSDHNPADDTPAVYTLEIHGTYAESASPSLSPSASQSPSSSVSPSPSRSPSASASPSSSVSLSPSRSPSASASPSSSVSLSPSVSPSASQSPSSSESLSPSRSPSLSPSPSSSISLSPSLSPSASESRSISATGSESSSPSSSESLSPSFSPSPSSSESLSPSLSPSASPSLSESPSPSATESFSPSETPSASPSLSPSASESPSPSTSVSASISPSQEPGTGLYSKEALTNLPTDSEDLAIIYGAEDETDVSTDNAVRVPQSGSTNYIAHQFKKENNTNRDSIKVLVNLQSTLAPSESPVYLQIYNNSTLEWETIDTDNATEANTDFDLTTTITSNVANYYDSNYITSFRVYQGL